MCINHTPSSLLPSSFVYLSRALRFPHPLPPPPHPPRALFRRGRARAPATFSQ